MRTLLIDNYDSFTFNLFQLLAEVNGCEPIVVRNDEAEWEELTRLDFDAVVLSPGPGHPARVGDFGVCAAAIAACELPLLGVCLGHQGLGLAYGGEVGAAPEPVHGRATAVDHAGSPLFAGIPRRFQAARYHSLSLREPLPPPLETIAWAEDGVPMALAHRSRPQWGVQFHPESVATEHGARLLANFRDLAMAGPGGGAPAPRRSRSRRGGTEPRRSAPGQPPRLRWRRLDWRDPERVFAALYGKARDAFWLDGAGEGAGEGAGGRFSFMGDASGPRAAVIGYDTDAGSLTVRRAGGEERRSESIFDFLDRELAALPRDLGEDLPFDFRCGFAGYFGYELKAECGGARAHSSPHPDAAFVFADRLLAFDHGEGSAYLLCLGGAEAEAEAWFAATAARWPEEGPAEPVGAGDAAAEIAALELARDRDRYLADVAECRSHLLAGESYELCLTNSAKTSVAVDPLTLYRRLRRLNPAPYSAFLRFGELSVLSSSPEQFLAVDGCRRVQTRPIKGTRERSEDSVADARLAASLATSEKDRAENLMIVDLARNDLGSVCEIGSVGVPSLMAVESYATVHQLVSTVSGRLPEEISSGECIRACFPPGSMTGAPKLRSMEILDRIEAAPRGVYSGAIGYLAPGDRCCLSVAIRTIVLGRDGARIGAGGAIVIDSLAEAEWEEMLLKAAAPARALAPDSRPAAAQAVPLRV